MNMEKSSTTMTPLAVKNGRKAVRKAKKFSDSSSSPSRRKSLQLLQPVAGDQSQLVGSDGVIRLTNKMSKTPKRKLASDGKSQPKKVFRPDGGKNFTIFEDTSSSSSSSQTRPSAEQEAIDMMTQAEPTGKYWEELAEERKVALEETLKENEQLFTENCELKEENDKLKVIAGQAEYLADVVETLISKLGSSGSRVDVSTSGSDEDDENKENDEDDENKENDEESDPEDDEDSEEEDEVFVSDDDIVEDDIVDVEEIDVEDDTVDVEEIDIEGKEDEV